MANWVIRIRQFGLRPVDVGGGSYVDEGEVWPLMTVGAAQESGEC